MATENTPPNDTQIPSLDQETSDKEKGKENSYMKNSLDMLEMFAKGGDDDKKDNQDSQSNSNAKQDKDPSQSASSESPIEMSQSADTLTGPTDALSGGGSMGSFDQVAAGNNASLNPEQVVQVVEANPEMLMML